MEKTAMLMQIHEENFTEITKDYAIICKKCNHKDLVTVPIETNIIQESLFTKFEHECSLCNYINT